MYAEAFGCVGITAVRLLEEFGCWVARRVLPDQDLAVDHRAIRQFAGQLAEFREALADQLFATRPDPDLPVALDQLGADAVPLPFDEPVLRRAEQGVELLDRGLQRMGEKEGVGLAAALRMFVFGLVGNQREVAFGAGTVRKVGIANQPLRDPFRIEIDQRGQRTGDQQFRDAHTKGAGDQFDADHQAEPVQLRP